MRYLAACDRFVLDQPGGAYRVAWDLARLMRDRGHEVALLCGSTEGDPKSGADVVEGITVVRYRFPRRSSLNPFRWRDHVLAARIQAGESLRGAQWDVVHAHSPASGTAAWNECGSGARLVYTVHSPVKLEQAINWRHRGLAGMAKLVLGTPILTRSEGELIRAAAKVHVLSDFTARCVLEIHGEEARDRLTRIPWWAPRVSPLEQTQAREALGWPKDERIFFTLRRLVPRMGLDTLVAAAARLAREEAFRIVVGGEGPERQRLEEMVRAVGLATKVTFAGRLTDRDVALAYSACDAFVLPTRELECFGIIALEAMAFGRPVIGSSAGAIPEIVRPVLPECIFPAGDDAALASLMERFLHRTLPVATDAELRRYAAEQYGEGVVAPRYAAMLEGAAAT
jgi:glycosyltransferase involved in cell wall biosynthesis